MYDNILPYVLGTILAGFQWLPGAEHQGQTDGIGKDGLYLGCGEEQALPPEGACLKSDRGQAFVARRLAQIGLNLCFVKSQSRKGLGRFSGGRHGTSRPWGV